MRGMRIEAWPSAIRAALEQQKASAEQRRAIGRLLRWALDKEFAPTAPATVGLFVDHLDATLARKRCYDVLSGLSLGLIAIEPAVDWSWLRARHRALGRDLRGTTGGRTSKPKPRKRTASLPLADWPPIYRSRWESAEQPGTELDPFGEFIESAGQIADWPLRRRKAGRRGWGMVMQAAQACPASGQIDTAVPGRLIASFEARKLRARSIETYLATIAEVAKFMEPSLDQPWLEQKIEFYRAQSKTVPMRKAGRVATGDKLLALGLTLCDEARRRNSALFSTAVLHRDGALIALLASVPARLKSFCKIEIGRHLELDFYPGHVNWTASETKEKRPEVYPLWPVVRDILDEHIACFRPTLLDGYRGARLWLTEHGGRPLGPGALRQQVKKHTLARLGVDMTPHLFRDAVAVTVSENAPNEMEIVTLTLSHRSAEADRPYRDQASTVAAANVVQAMIRQDRVEQERRARIESSTCNADMDEVFGRFQ